MKKFLGILFIFFIGLIGVLNLQASESAIWSTNTRADVLRGDAQGVSISDTGAISLAPRLTEIFKTEQPYVWSSAVDANGNIYLGTGSDGKIYRVDRNGKGTLFADTNELNVSALAIGTNGELYAGTSPDGKVYRIGTSGAPEIYFEPQEKYIWSLATMSDGSLAVGTGENGKIYRVKTANAKPETALFFDTSETHIISLAADKNGNLYAGTDGKGLVLRFGADGKPFALLDSPLREIHQIVVGSDNLIYALGLSETTATPKPAAVPAAATENLIAPTDPNAAPQPEPPPKSRYDLTAAKTVIYRISADGGSDIIWNSPTVTGFSIALNPNGDGVLLGTSDKGRIYSITDDSRETLLLQSNEGQISTLLARGTEVFAGSSNQGKLYRFGAETVGEAVYESSIFNARTAAAWGRIWWRASGGAIVLQTRSGNTENPDETWSAWSANYTDSKGAAVSSPPASFLQWRAIFKNAATLNEVNVAYLPRNIAPEILAIQILPTNVGLLANPPIQIDPNIESSGIDPTFFGLPPIFAVPPRRVYQRGARALQWTAEDRNGDRLEYAVYFREVGETEFKLLRERLRENFLTIDGLALADGRYIFKIAARDAASNPAAQSLVGEKISEPVNIDNSAPVVTADAPLTGAGAARVVFAATDAASYLTKAEYSINGGDWQEVYADDGISDGRVERYTVQVDLISAGENSITLRVFDANGNAGNARVLVRK